MEETLRRLEPLVVELSRRPGQKESRWSQVLGGAPPLTAALVADERQSSEPLSARVQRLEEQLAALTDELHSFKAKLGE